MIKNKYPRIFLAAVFLAAFLFFTESKQAFANPQIISATLNGLAQNVIFNPTAGESVSIQVKASVPVKFTRLYICLISQICNGTSGNYTKYFTQTDILDTITKSWDGKNSAGVISAEGEYKISVSMLETGASESTIEPFPYSITSSLSGQSQNSTSTSSTTVNTSNVPSSSHSTYVAPNAYVSTHSGEEDLSDYNESQIFETSAGRQRISYVGTPTEFKALYKIPKDMEGIPVAFNWSFGDGFAGSGEKVFHTYKYPGEYNIILNSESGDHRAISRTLIKVLSPNLAIALLPDGDLEILNKGNTEINLGLWKLGNVFRDFTFAQDTIIGAGKKIFLSSKDTKINTENNRIFLNNPSGGEIVAINTIDNSQLSLASNVTNVIAESIASPDITYQLPVVNSPQPKESDLSGVASVIESVSSTSSVGFLGRVWKGSISGIKSFARLFYDF